MADKPENPKRLRIAVLASGGGTNLQAMIDRLAAGSLLVDISVVLSDRPDARALVRARDAGIPAICIDYNSFPVAEITETLSNPPIDLHEIDRKQRIIEDASADRRLFRLARLVLAERKLIAAIEKHGADYVVFAGFMRLVTPYFIGHFNSAGALKVINIHPALLPSFPGTRGYEDTFGYGGKWGGITVHFVDEGEDTGPIIAQAVYPIFPADNEESIKARGLSLEYEVYPQVINWLARGYVNILRSPGKRPRVEISDPEYADILRTWIRKAFES